MKIKVTTAAKKWLTVAEMPAVQEMIKDFKDDETKVSELVQMAARLVSGCGGEHFEILKAEAEIAGNVRVWNQYSDNSGRLDVWIRGYAFSPYCGFYEIGAYLSDIWQIGDPKHNKELEKHMYIRKYKEVD